jgi:NAD(P)-dependent dehydrogenase (short-subunit alcohol dehydrogenase family)
MAILHLMIGLPCSGKTTYARKLAGETNALLLTHQGSAYAATKHAVEGLTKSIAEEVAAAVLYLGQCAFGQKKGGS